MTVREKYDNKKSLSEKYTYNVEKTDTFKRFMKLLIAGENNVYQALQREKDLDKYIEQDLVRKFDGVYRSRPATYFTEKPVEPLTLDQVLKQFLTKGAKPKKKKAKRVINIDKKKQDINTKYKIGRSITERIPKRVDKFLYLSNLQSKNQMRPKNAKAQDERSAVKTARPVTSRGTRIKICTDMRIMSLDGGSPRHNVTTPKFIHSRGKATFYTDRKSHTSAQSRNNLLHEHKTQSQTILGSLNKSGKRQRPFTAKLTSPDKTRTTGDDQSATIIQVMH